MISTGHHGRRSLMAGITGRDGSCLSELLLEKCYVHGTMRRTSTFNADHTDHTNHDPHAPGPKVTLGCGMSDTSVLRRVIEAVRRDEAYRVARRRRMAAPTSDERTLS